MTTKSTRSDEMRIIRRLVRGVGCVRRTWRLTHAELRHESKRLLADRIDWLTPSERLALAGFVAETN